MSKDVSDVKQIYRCYSLSDDSYQDLEKKHELENSYNRWDFIQKSATKEQENKEKDCYIN